MVHIKISKKIYIQEQRKYQLINTRQAKVMTAARLRLASVIVVVTRWSMDLDVIFISDVRCTIMIEDEQIGSFHAKNISSMSNNYCSINCPFVFFLKHTSTDLDARAHTDCSFFIFENYDASRVAAGIMPKQMGKQVFKNMDKYIFRPQTFSRVQKLSLNSKPNSFRLSTIKIGQFSSLVPLRVVLVRDEQ